MEKRIEIECFNPYESRFPNRKLVSLDTLILIKHLRNEGYEVVVTPDDGTPFQYLYKKGVKEILSDPVNLFLLNIPVTIATTLFSNYLQKLIDRRNKEEKPTINLQNVIINNKVINKNYYLDGSEIDSKSLDIRNKKGVERKKHFNKCFSLSSPYIKYPIPILLEHEPRVVGWCNLAEHEEGLKTEGIITDKIIRRRVDQGRLKGFSITGIATKTECSICNKSYIDCNHISGLIYENKYCSNRIIQGEFVEVSLVKRPVNERCLLDLK